MGNSLIKEAENIINEYIKENRYSVMPDRRGKRKGKCFTGSRLFSNTVIDILMLGSIALLIYLVCRLL